MKKLMILVMACALIAAISVPAFATDVADSGSGQFTIYIDANGNEVFHNMPTNGDMARSQPIIIDETAEVRAQLAQQPNNATGMLRANTYNTETNPVKIGTWSGVDAYARHTLGTQSSSGTKKYLTTQGDATWYNTKSLTALPYRNGNATVTEHVNKIDVKSGTSVTVTGTDSGTSITVTVNDFGPNQKSDPGNKTIVDLDKSDFTTVFGNASIGRAHCKTKVEVQQYFN